MSGITETQASGFQVEYADDEGNEHIGLVVFGDRTVHLAHNLGRRGGLLGEGAEQAACNGHEEWGRNTFARYVTDDEVKPVIVDKEIVEVAAYFFGRMQYGM